MAIVGIESLTYVVKDLDESRRFFEDFGLLPVDDGRYPAVFGLADGSRIVLCSQDDTSLPQGTKITSDGVQEIVWGVDSEAALEKLVGHLRTSLSLEEGSDSVMRFVTPFGVPMGLKVFRKRPMACAPDALNAPGHVGRLNQHRKWRRRARPKAISHVAFAVPDVEAVCQFMIEMMNFRLSDVQKGLGAYLRADGSQNHHSFALANANAPFPGMDGTVQFHHTNFVLEDIDEIMVGANYMARKGWPSSKYGLGRHRVDSALFYYLDCPAGGEAEYGADQDLVDDGWIPREFDPPLFGFSHFVHNLPAFLLEEPEWGFKYLTDTDVTKAPL